MFKWFRQKNKQKECNHYKESGQPYPINMVEIVRFSPYKSDFIGYGIVECTECKKRAFACIPCHLMTQDVCDIIDSFIAHEIDWNTFREFLSNNMAWYKEK